MATITITNFPNSETATAFALGLNYLDHATVSVPLVAGKTVTFEEGGLPADVTLDYEKDFDPWIISS
jgi:hypothetical protein